MAFYLLLLLISFVSAQEEACDATETESNENEIKRRYIGETGAPKDESIPPGQFRHVPAPEDAQFWVTFINDRNEPVDLFWDNDTPEGRLQANIDPLSSTSVGTYRTHKFFFTLPGSEEKLITFVMDASIKQYVLQVPEEQKRLEDEAIVKKREFKQEYRAKTGIEWIAYYPREPTQLYMYPAKKIGEIFKITSDHGFYNCYPETVNEEDVNKCKDNTPLELEIVFQSISPKVLTISNFLSDFECDHIIELAKPRLNRSTIGDYEDAQVSNTRTSTSTFISRKESEILDGIHRRVADVMNIDEAHLWNHVGCEDLQVLHYDVGQQFFDHPDYGVKSPNMRYLTFLMYLNDVEEGGETEFRSISLKVFPKKGDVVAFYSALEDGNADSRSIHAGRAIIKGEKWAAPLWVWDPHR